jgi:hypothetical protein
MSAGKSGASSKGSSIIMKYKKPLAVVLVLILCIAGGLYWAILPKIVPSYETGKATVDDLIKVTSTRKAEGSPTMVPETSRYLPLIATPVTVYYSGKAGNATASPLYVAGHDSVAYGIKNFMTAYGNSDVVAIGDLGAAAKDATVTDTILGQDDKETSILVAKYYWTQSDAAILVKDTDDGYYAAVSVTNLASFLNIPVIVTHSVDAPVVSELKSLGVKYTIVCGNMKGYNKVMHFDDIEKVSIEELTWNATARIIRERLGLEVDYIALANPLDTYQKEVLATYIPDKFPIRDNISNSDAAAYPGAAASTSAGNPCFNFTVPADYEFANLVVDMWLDVSGENWGDFAGARLYAYIGVDGNKDGVIDATNAQDKLQFFGGTPAYEIEDNQAPISGGSLSDWMKPAGFGHLHTEIPLYNDTGEHAIQLLARLPTDWGSNYLVSEPGDYTAPFILNITIQKLAKPTYPLMDNLSTLAPYLAAYRHGVVLAQPHFQLHDLGYIGCKDCGDPAANEDVLDDANNRTAVVKTDLNRLLGSLMGVDGTDPASWANIEQYYGGLSYDKMMHVGIIGDTNMVPQYYYMSTGQGDATEGFGIPSDIYYQDIAVNQTDNALRELNLQIAIGRVDGWNSQEVSALLARTFFYDNIIANWKGPMNGQVAINGVGDLWKDSAMTAIGTEPPVGAAITAGEKIGLMFEQAGFSASIAAFGDPRTGHTLDASRRQRAGPYYESSNFVHMCAHGFYYWYVPPAWEGTSLVPRYTVLPPISGGGAFDVAHVNLMNFGPSVMWADSCVTGRIDGIIPENALSLSFLHAGMNVYIGATRESWGSIMPIPDATSGESMGSYLSMNFYGHLTGYFYDKSGGMQSFNPQDTTVGCAMVLAKNNYVQKFGVDSGGVDSDTLEEFIIHGDPAFNPYEPNHAK